MKSGTACPICADIHLDENPFSYKVAEFEHTYVRLQKITNEREVLLSEAEYGQSIRALQQALHA
jgi:hypothetical protein